MIRPWPKQKRPAKTFLDIMVKKRKRRKMYKVLSEKRKRLQAVFNRDSFGLVEAEKYVKKLEKEKQEKFFIE